MDYTEHEEEKKNDEQVQARPPHVAVLSTAPNVTCPLRQMSHYTYSPGLSDRQTAQTERRDLQNSKRQQLQLATSSQGKPELTAWPQDDYSYQNGAGCLATQNGADQASITLKLCSLVLIWACYASLVVWLLGKRAIRPRLRSISGPMNEHNAETAVQRPFSCQKSAVNAR